MNHLETSQICFGLLLTYRKSPKAFLSDDFSIEYSDAVKYMQENDDWCKEDLVKIISPSSIQTAEYAIKAINGMGDTTDWASLMHDYAEDARLGDVLEKSGRNLKKGKPIDYLSLSGHIQNRVLKNANGPTTLENIDCENYHPFMPSGDDVVDGILGGIPADGPIVIYGLTSVGKSHRLASWMGQFLLHHKEKTGVIYTLEMGAEHWKWRETKMYPYLNDVKDRLFVSSSVRNIEELVAEVSAKQFGIVGIDDLDGLAKENSAAEFERLYKKIKEICRFLKIPVYVLAQPNRAAKISNKFIGRYDVAWSGAAENSAALLVALQRANELDMDYDDENPPPFTLFSDDHEYMIFYKSRDGWPGDYPDRYPRGQYGPGAIILEKGKHLWEGKPLGRRVDERTGEILSVGTLWREGSKKKLMKKKKRYNNDD